MPDAVRKLWHSISFYKGYLPDRVAHRARKYVILACEADPALDTVTSPAGHPHHSSVTSAQSLAPLASPNNTAESIPSHTRMVSSGVVPFLVSPVGSPGSELHDDFIPAEATVLNHQPTPYDVSHSVKSEVLVGHPPAYHFYMYQKRDVLPPPLKLTLAPTTITSCFMLCENTECQCERLHVPPNVWRLRLDTLKPIMLTVSDTKSNIHLSSMDIFPTAGYLFSLGLIQLNIVQDVVPTLCRYNGHCRNGSRCLYIHAATDPPPHVEPTAEVTLRALAHFVGSEDTCIIQEAELFFDFLACQGIETVGDLQMLSTGVFETFATQLPEKWLKLFLIVSVVRNFDRKTPMIRALGTFPRVHQPLILPHSISCVGQLVDMHARDFYHLGLPPHVMDACERIRARYEPQVGYNVILLSKEPASSFFTKMTDIITHYREDHAHYSWRKNDPSRPIVTSVLTYVDVTTCTCHIQSPMERSFCDLSVENNNCFLETVYPQPAANEPPMGFPRSSWCRCPRRWEIAVNYELSTPSGSRCSEQNVMGKLAALGVPTWGVREVFVHGSNLTKEINPLFPCGVCENMLQKVTRDVRATYGGDVVLYMFDAVLPKKIVCLPISEISHREGANFSHFVAHALREM